MFGIPPARGFKSRFGNPGTGSRSSFSSKSRGRGDFVGARGNGRFNAPKPDLRGALNEEEEDGAVDYGPDQDGYREDFRDPGTEGMGQTADEAADLLFIDAVDEKMGFEKYTEGPERVGWLVNLRPTLVKDADWPGGKSAVDLYFLEDDGNRFKTTLVFEPYILVCPKDGSAAEVEEHLRRKFERQIYRISRQEKEDLDLPNHLIGATRTVLKLEFHNVKDLLAVRKVLLQIVVANKMTKAASAVYEEGWDAIQYEDPVARKSTKDPLDLVEDVREYDVPYYIRVAIDMNIRVGYWYSVMVDPKASLVTLRHREDILHRAEPVVLAFDIETTKQPLKFPDAASDVVMMISYMIDGQGYLITNREVVSDDIEDFEYSPKPEYEGPFTVFNEENEAATLSRFFSHIISVRPSIFATYNGDFFDWPFIETRAKANGMDMFREIGWRKDSAPGGGDVYRSSYGIHMDCFAWVKRDSYLPQGSQGLKAVTSAKLGYNPMELDPEDMTRFASERPQTLAQYSVSDAVATYYLFMKYVNPFIFSLCTIIPGCGDDVLRKGSGTLCEMLLMVQAFNGNILMPNKYVEERGKMFEGHLIYSETYVGGHVEALEAGVFRSDLATKFRIVPEAAQELISTIDEALKFTIEVEHKAQLSDVENYEEVRNGIISRLKDLHDRPLRSERPLIYHLDVSAMYPNIMLTNRLQPDSMVDENVCASCDFNSPDSDCQREMSWSWRAEYFPPKRNEVNMLRNVLENERFKGKNPWDPMQSWHEISKSEQTKALESRVGDYSAKVYNKKYESKIVPRKTVVCQRENPFYVDTVRQFRDRRYEYKGQHKLWKKRLDDAMQNGNAADIDRCKKMVVLFDSLQTAHKCILNSFYGYVMRKGSRWYSMEMAGVVCLTGASIIQMARQFVEKVGRPLELDTDGIWCILPQTFPDNFSFKLKNGKSITLSYPCAVLNHQVHQKFSNHQYQNLVDAENHVYSKHSENSIFFEVDGPYRAMILPASTEEDKLLKKRYAVFNDDGTLAELKGFEVKRRGELKLIKTFQSEIFRVFLDGNTLESCYAAVAEIANRWLDILYSKGADLEDEELFDLISENRSMSKSLQDYGTQKSTSISTAKRLAEFLGDQMVKDKGLNCKFVISAKPAGAPVSERSIPVVIFQAESSVMKHYLRLWLKDPSLNDFDIRGIVDWSYYLERFGSVIQKLITIPAAMQKVSNPVPRIKHPNWLGRRVAERDDAFKQSRITDMMRPQGRFAEADSDVQTVTVGDVADVENLASPGTGPRPFLPALAKVTKPGRVNSTVMHDEPDAETDEPSPSLHENYPGWLEGQMSKWKRQKTEKHRVREIHGPLATSMPGRRDGRRRGQTFSGSGSGVSSFLRKQLEALLKHPWEVLQIAEGDSPGEFRIWALVNRNLHSIKLSIPRVFYVNARKPYPEESLNMKKAFKVERRTRVLPRSHQCLNLYEFSMTEQVFRDNAKQISSFVSHPQIEGVYEMQVPLLYRALINLGAMVCVSPSKRTLFWKTGIDNGLMLDDLARDGNRQAYLDNASTRLSYVFLYHCNSDNRHLIGLFFTAVNRAQVLVVDRTNQLPNLQKAYADHRLAVDKARSELTRATQGASASSQRPEATHFAYHESLDFSAEVHQTEKDAFKAVQRALGQYADERRGPTILVIQSQRTPRYLADRVGNLSEFPYLTIPSHKADNSFPALDWQRPAARRMMAHLFNVDTCLQDRVKLAQYVDAPLCNIEPDFAVFSADLSLARRLQRHDMLLWLSLSDRPDLGGREADENHFVVEELTNPETNKPGFYGNVCVELEVGQLVVNTLLRSGYINELEGSSMAVGFDHSTYSLDSHLKGTPVSGREDDGSQRSQLGDSKRAETVESAVIDDQAVSTQHFKVMQMMVSSWVSEVLDTRGKWAEMLVEHCLRWLTSPNSKFYDPAMYALIHGMMRKVFAQLLGELKRLNSKVVFADFSKIVISTPKPSMRNAVAYTQYALKAISSKPLFDVLEIEPVQFWDHLMWMDVANFAGIAADPENVASSAVAQRPKIEMKWNIKEYLPPAVQPSFIKIVAEVIYQTYMRKVEWLKKNPLGIIPITKRQPQTDGVETDGIPTDQGSNLDEKRIDDRDAGSAHASEEVKFKRKLVEHTLGRQLLSLVKDISRNVSAAHAKTDEDRVAASFPHLPGSHLAFSNPAMEFSKSVCAVLDLDDTIQHEVRILKKNLLNLIGVSDFAASATFANPCETVKLSRVICDYCNLCRDLDLCRDPDLLPDLSSGTPKPRPWLCTGCGTEHDKRAIEEALVNMVNRLLLAWQLQDVTCLKCKWVKGESLRSVCSNCGAQYAATKNKSDVLKRITVLKGLATMHGFELLGEMLDFVANAGRK